MSGKEIDICNQRNLKWKQNSRLAIEYGWESHSGFIKAFKSYYGFSPSLLYAMKLEIIHFGDRDMRAIATFIK